SAIASPTAIAVTVQNPAPGGGVSGTLQFQVDSAVASGSAPTFSTSTATVSAGTTATYPVTLPSSASNVSVQCLNLPAGSSCSYSSSGAVSVVTGTSSPTGTYHVTVVFTET